MSSRIQYIAIAMILLVSCGENSDTTKEHKSVLDGRIATPALRADIRYLASDELEGRDTGTRGEQLAADHIISRMTEVGLTPKGTEGFRQPFEFTGSPAIGEDKSLTWNERELIYEQDWYPLNFSGNGNITGKLEDLGFGIFAPDLEWNDYEGKEIEGKVVLISVSSPDGIHPHSKYVDYHDLSDRAEKALGKGAKAVVFHKDDMSVKDPSSTMTAKSTPLSGPVIFVKDSPPREGAVDLNLEIERKKLTGYNVIGFDDKGKELTFVIGAHYDHLGYGLYGSLHADGPAIHNGADDNASGVAAMLQLAEDFEHMDLEHNVLYIAFSGEERGLLGSNHYSKHPTIPHDQIDYMLNMDMVGRLDSTENLMGINAVGTSPAWDFIDSLEFAGVRAKTSESGVGPSDHTNFYLQDIPVLHFFSGTHEDYHKPSDDEALINYKGMNAIIGMMEEIVLQVDTLGELEFTQTVEKERTATAFKVTLGVIPDYLYEDHGMRIDGVNKERPADKAGIQKGDVVVRLGDYEVADIYEYMEALSKFESGMTIEVEVDRKGERVVSELTFD